MEAQPESPAHPLNMELFTTYYRVTGHVTTNAYRTNGVLNTPEGYLLLDNVVTSNLLRPQETPVNSRYSRIAKNSVILAVPNDEAQSEQRWRASKIYNRVELLEQRVLIGLGNFEVSGNLHLKPTRELENLIIDRPEQFIGVTDAELTFLLNPTLKFTTHTLLINKTWVDFICAGTP